MVCFAEGAGWKEGKDRMVDVGHVFVDDFVEPFYHVSPIAAYLNMLSGIRCHGLEPKSQAKHAKIHMTTNPKPFFSTLEGRRRNI